MPNHFSQKYIIHDQYFLQIFATMRGGGLVQTMNDFALAKNLTFFNQQFFAQSSGRMSRFGGKI